MTEDTIGCRFLGSSVKNVITKLAAPREAIFRNEMKENTLLRLRGIKVSKYQKMNYIIS